MLHDLVAEQQPDDADERQRDVGAAARAARRDVDGCTATSAASSTA